MISQIIEWCAHNRFLVFTGVLLLTLTGIWSMGHIPLDALPDISDVRIIHTSWEGQLVQIILHVGNVRKASSGIWPSDQIPVSVSVRTPVRTKNRLRAPIK